MKKEDLILLIMAALLLLGMFLTLKLGGERSRHGYGRSLSPPAETQHTDYLPAPAFFSTEEGKITFFPRDKRT